MVILYNILNNDQGQPILNIQREIDIDETNISIEESVKMLNHFFDMNRLNNEHAYLIGFDNNMNIKGIFLVSVGDYNKCYFHQRNIITFLILSGSNRFILYHNHPNGTLDVSEGDSLASLNIKTLAKDIDIEMIDSVIITKNGWRCIERGASYEYEDEYDEDEF